MSRRYAFAHTDNSVWYIGDLKEVPDDTAFTSSWWTVDNTRWRASFCQLQVESITKTSSMLTASYAPSIVSLADVSRHPDKEIWYRYPLVHLARAFQNLTQNKKAQWSRLRAVHHNTCQTVYRSAGSHLILFILNLLFAG